MRVHRPNASGRSSSKRNTARLEKTVEIFSAIQQLLDAVRQSDTDAVMRQHSVLAALGLEVRFLNLPLVIREAEDEI